MGTKDILSWVFAVVSITGVILNIYHDKRCFIIWSIGNAFWTVFFLMHHLYAPALLQAIYFILAIAGLYKWHKEGK